MVKNLARLLGAAHLTATETLRTHRHRIHHPMRDIKVVHMLLQNVVAGEPGVEIPVPDLVMQLAFVCRALHPGPRLSVPLCTCAPCTCAPCIGPPWACPASSPSTAPELAEIYAAKFDPVLKRLMGMLREAMPGAADADMYWCYHMFSGSIMVVNMANGSIEHLSDGLCHAEDFDEIEPRLVRYSAEGFRNVCMVRRAAQ